MALLSLTLSGCAVQIKNQRWYGDVGNGGAIWFETLTDKAGKIDKREWDDMRLGMACTDLNTLAQIKGEIEKLCSHSGVCNYQKVAATLDRFQQRMNGINGK